MVLKSRTSRLVLFVAHLLQPVGSLAVEGFNDSNVSHGNIGRSPVPMLFSRRKPNDVPWLDLFDGPSPALRQSGACGDYQGLAQRVSVPCGACTGLKGDAGSDAAGRCLRLEQGGDPHIAGKVFG